MFLWHTVEDHLVPLDGTLDVGLALYRAKVPFRMSVYPYGLHGVALSTELTSNCPDSVQPIAASWTREADEWMQTLASN